MFDITDSKIGTVTSVKTDEEGVKMKVVVEDPLLYSVLTGIGNLSSEEARLRIKLRQILGKGLDSVHVDLIHVLATHAKEEMLDYMASVED